MFTRETDKNILRNEYEMDKTAEINDGISWMLIFPETLTHKTVDIKRWTTRKTVLADVITFIVTLITIIHVVLDLWACNKVQLRHIPAHIHVFIVYISI